MKSLPLLLPYKGKARIKPIEILTPRISLAWQVYQKTLHFLRFSRERMIEFSWVGKVEKVEPLQYLISELKALPHSSDPISTILDAQAIGQTASQWIEEGGGNYNPLKFWGHTHLSSSTNPSFQDDKQIELFVNGQLTPEFFIRGIFGLCLQPQLTALSNPQFTSHPSYQSYNVGGNRSACPVEFTIFDYKKGIQIQNVPWEVVDQPCEVELDSFVKDTVTIQNWQGNHLEKVEKKE